MEKMELRRHIDQVMEKVGQMGSGWRYVPLNKLPEGAEVVFEVGHAVLPLEPRKINNKDEVDGVDVIRLSEGQYTLQIGIWPSVSLDQFKGVTVDVKPLNLWLAPTSCFEANIDIENLSKNHPDDPPTRTCRLTTGPIRSILIKDTDFVLSDKDTDTSVQYMNKSRRYRNTYRQNNGGFSNRKRGSRPLRKRRN